MSIELNTTAHITEDEKVQIIAVVNNHSSEPVRIGGMTSKLYDITAKSTDGEHYGDSCGYLQAPHHLTVPSEESAVFVKEYETEAVMREKASDLSIDTDDFLEYITCLEADIEEPVNVNVTVYLQSDDKQSLQSTFTFTPSSLETQEKSEIIAEMKEYPRTENSIQLG